MPDFRTTAPNQGGKGNDKDWLREAIERAYSQVKDDPKAQAKIGLSLQENYGIPADLLIPALPKMGEGLEQIEETEAQQQTQAQQGPMQLHKQPAQAEQSEANNTPQQTPDTNMSDNNPQQTPAQTKEPTPDEVIGFLDEIISLVGDDMTLGELKDWAENNPDMVKTAIKLKF